MDHFLPTTVLQGCEGGVALQRRLGQLLSSGPRPRLIDREGLALTREHPRHLSRLRPLSVPKTQTS